MEKSEVIKLLRDGERSIVRDCDNRDELLSNILFETWPKKEKRTVFAPDRYFYGAKGQDRWVGKPMDTSGFVAPPILLSLVVDSRSVQDKIDEKYPEHAKLNKIKEQSQFTGELLDFLGSKGYFIAEYKTPENSDHAQVFRVNKSVTQILAEMFNIDLNKIEEENDAILKEFQELQKQQNG